MSTSRLDPTYLPLVKIPVTTPAAPSTAPSTVPKPLGLFDLTRYENSKGAAPERGALGLPGLSQDEQAQIRSLFGDLDEADQEKLEAASRKLAQALLASAGQAPLQLTDAGPQADASSPGDDSNAWAAPESTVHAPRAAANTSTLAFSQSGLTAGGLATSASALNGGSTPVQPAVSVVAPAVSQNINLAGQAYTQATGSEDYDSAVVAVSYMGLLGLRGELTNYALEVKSNQDAARGVSVDLADVRQSLANWPEDVQTQSFSWSEIDSTTGKVTRHENVQLTREQAAALRDNLQDQLTSMQSVTQEQHMRLQDLTQKYQQAINTISNLLKYQHDTVKAIIQNIHA